MMCGIVSLTLFLCASLSQAEEFEQELRFSGFGTVGIATSDSSEIALTRDLTDSNGVLKHGSPFLADSRLGLQVDAQLSPMFSATAQLLLRDRVENNFENSVEWAFLKFQPNQSFQTRLGRIGMDLFMLSDQRNVGYTYVWVRPPTEFYGPLAIYHFDGADVRYSLPMADGVLEAKLLYGTSKNEFFSKTDLVTSKHSIDFQPLGGGNLVFRNDTLTLRAGYAHLTFDSDYPQSAKLIQGLSHLPPFYTDSKRLINALALNNTSMQYLSVGASYDNERWLLQGELAKSTFESQAMPDYVSGYALAAYRIGKWTPYTSFSKIHPTSPEIHGAPPRFPVPSIQALVKSYDSAINAARYDQQTMSVGTRWDFYRRMALKLQYDHTSIEKNGYGLAPWTQRSNDGDTINALSLTLDWVF